MTITIWITIKFIKMMSAREEKLYKKIHLESFIYKFEPYIYSRQDSSKY